MIVQQMNGKNNGTQNETTAWCSWLEHQMILKKKKKKKSLLSQGPVISFFLKSIFL